jgi:hypothetical protein
MVTNQIFVQIGSDLIELTGAEKTAFIAQREADQLELQILKDAKTARKEALDSAITKLKALGLTETEAKIIIGIE